ncbi:hypothetical protein Skr01_56960 [Sphaerisporangium krabiense]|uniref:Uncharacterized protein n=1 Tax=Sphaerisporangium krabiense TaxID=763782 RepID=A0A7W8Z8X9_9ACTN|nr:hypothetical protein [Sphaerisporangium krabiense]MBB5629535.1 hypothetical protein [Sphaerisporangium krabiense]GII65611.1 hypothetical protein Skr01_56960 [Sphaerisporangium krabiense]
MNTRKCASLVGAALVSAAIVAGTATPAHAIPDTCSITPSPIGYLSSYCTTGTGYHALRVTYRFVNPQLGGYTETVTGPWAAVGSLSSVKIPGADVLGSIILKSD